MKQCIYVSHFDCDKNIFEVRNYDTDECVSMNISKFKEFVSTLKNAVIYQNNVNIIASFLPGGNKDGFKKSKDGKSEEIITYKLEDVTFKSFTVLCPSDQDSVSMIEMYGVKTPTEAMIAHIEMLGGTKNLSRTICGQSVKMFYRDIKDGLWRWKKQNKVYINTVEQFNLLHAGSKKGLLYKPNCLKAHGKTLEFDLSAAYCGAFVQSNKFPVGKPRFTRNANTFLNELKKGNNAKLVYNGRMPEVEKVQKEIHHDFYDDYNNVTALEFYDFVILRDLGVNIVDLVKKYDCEFVYYDQTSYIHRDVTDKIVSLQEEKDCLQKGTPERSLVKCQMEFIYGKPIQKRSFKNDGEVVRHYRCRGENYITPQMSNHASAYVRFQLYKAIKTLGEDVFYWDTDGIKVNDTEETREYFRKENERLLQLNRDNGYESNIGLWKMEEFDEFIAVRPKIYVTRTGSKIEVTAAGMDEFSKKLSLINTYIDGAVMASDYIKTIEKNGFYFRVKQILKDGDSVCVKYTPFTRLTGKED